MNKPWIIAFGALVTIFLSLTGFLFIPSYQFITTDAVETIKLTNEFGDEIEYPIALSEQAIRGRVIYQREGCTYCHSQQVRPKGFGADQEHWKWGDRRSVPRDYILQRPVLLGTMRTGPDLANVGARYNKQWQHLHLFHALTVSVLREKLTPEEREAGVEAKVIAESIMPPYRYLYRVVEYEPKNEEAYKLPPKYSEEYYGGPRWIIPGQDARDLVAYLLELKQPFSLSQVNPTYQEILEMQKKKKKEAEEAAAKEGK